MRMSEVMSQGTFPGKQFSLTMYVHLRKKSVLNFCLGTHDKIRDRTGQTPWSRLCLTAIDKSTDDSTITIVISEEAHLIC